MKTLQQKLRTEPPIYGENGVTMQLRKEAKLASERFSRGDTAYWNDNATRHRNYAKAIRSLPLTPIKEEKSTPEFLPKASTKEVGIK